MGRLRPTSADLATEFTNIGQMHKSAKISAYPEFGLSVRALWQPHETSAHFILKVGATLALDLYRTIYTLAGRCRAEFFWDSPGFGLSPSKNWPSTTELPGTLLTNAMHEASMRGATCGNFAPVQDGLSSSVPGGLLSIGWR